MHLYALGNRSMDDSGIAIYKWQTKIVNQVVGNCGICVGIIREDLAKEIKFESAKVLDGPGCYMLDTSD